MKMNFEYFKLEDNNIIDGVCVFINGENTFTYCNNGNGELVKISLDEFRDICCKLKCLERKEGVKYTPLFPYVISLS